MKTIYKVILVNGNVAYCTRKLKCYIKETTNYYDHQTYYEISPVFKEILTDKNIMPIINDSVKKNLTSNYYESFTKISKEDANEFFDSLKDDENYCKYVQGLYKEAKVKKYEKNI